jgi:hypothetical protein
MAKKQFKPGGFLSGQVFTLDDSFFNYKNAYGKYSNVPRNSIKTVVLDTKGRGQSILKIIGEGSELALIPLPHTWALKTQQWLIEELKI